MSDVSTRWAAAPSPGHDGSTASRGPSRAREPESELAACWSARLLSAEGDVGRLAQRAAIGALLASAYGLALGAREGGAALLAHAVGVPAALLAVTLLGLPALYILLSLFDAPLSARDAFGAAVRGLASAGLALAGFAPLCALYVVTSASDDAAAIAGTLGLVVGGALGLRQLVSTLRAALHRADSATRFVAALSQLGFSLFATLLAWRVWSALLPLVGGA